MFEKFKEVLGVSKNKDRIHQEIEDEIVELGDTGVECAMKKLSIPLEMAIERLDQIRLKGEKMGMGFIVISASRQIDRIREASV